VRVTIPLARAGDSAAKAKGWFMAAIPKEQAFREGFVFSGTAQRPAVLSHTHINACATIHKVGRFEK